MPSFAPGPVAVIVAFIIAASAFIGSATPAAGTYPTTVKLISGLVAIAGSIYLARAISLTLLRSGGTMAFRAAYVAAAALGGVGLAEATSALCPANIGNALASYCFVSVASGMLWVRFYGRAA